MADALSYSGQQRSGDAGTEFSTLQFLMRQVVNLMSTATIVKVAAVTNDGGIVPVGFVDLQPLVNLVDGAWQSVPHGVIYHCPYFRLQGGANAVIIDPEVGDLGIAIFADRDISSVMANKAQANPGSRRRFDMADGMYLGGVLNGTPTQYVQMSAAGIKLHSPTAIVLDALSIELTCQTFALNATISASITTPTLTINGNIHTTGNNQNDGSMIVNGGTILGSTLAVAGIANMNGGIVDGLTGKNIDGNHEHDHGTMTLTGQTGTVI